MVNLILSIPYFSTVICKTCTAVNIKFNNEHGFFSPHPWQHLSAIDFFQTNHADLGEITF